MKKLLTKARDSDPTLPTFEGYKSTFLIRLAFLYFSVTTSGNFHVDEYGFRHTFEDVPLALHYICTQLNEHYVSQSDDYANLKQKWKTLLHSSPEYVENTVGLFYALAHKLEFSTKTASFADRESPVRFGRASGKSSSTSR